MQAKMQEMDMFDFLHRHLCLHFCLYLHLQTKAQMQVEKPCWNPECINAHTCLTVLACVLDVC